VATYSARFYEGRYIQGRIAAKTSKSGVLGYIGSFPIPEVISGMNSTILGAQSVNPDIKVKIIWVNSWFDPGKEADAGKALLDQGADVIMQHTDSPAAMQIAEARHAHAFGQDSDMIKFGPTAQLTAIVNNWGPYYVERVQAAPGQETCLVSFVASSANPSPSLSDWIIESGQWKGVNC
jgi:simple sugar transport system substrate-binding protein